jgi:Zn/Cd-binding protein ZinT
MAVDICYLVMGPLDPILNSDQMKYLNHSQHAIVEEKAFYHFHNFHMKNGKTKLHPHLKGNTVLKQNNIYKYTVQITLPMSYDWKW